MAILTILKWYMQKFIIYKLYKFDASLKIKRKNGTLSNDYSNAKYIFYDSEGIFISVSIDNSFYISNNNNAYKYSSLYTIRTDNSYIIKAFSMIDYDSGGYNLGSDGRGLKIIICYI